MERNIHKYAFTEINHKFDVLGAAKNYQGYLESNIFK